MRTPRTEDTGKDRRGDDAEDERVPDVPRRNEGIIPQEEEATGYLPVVEGDDSYDVLRMPHERDESVDPAPPPRDKPPRAPS